MTFYCSSLGYFSTDIVSIIGNVTSVRTKKEDRKKFAYYIYQRQLYQMLQLSLSHQQIRCCFIHWLIQPSVDIEDSLSKTIRDATRKGVNSKNVGSLPCRIPSLQKQKEVVTYLDNLQTKINTLRTLQTQTATKLDAFLPAILDKAFKGQL